MVSDPSDPGNDESEVEPPSPRVVEGSASDATIGLGTASGAAGPVPESPPDIDDEVPVGSHPGKLGHGVIEGISRVVVTSTANIEVSATIAAPTVTSVSTLPPPAVVTTVIDPRLTDLGPEVAAFMAGLDDAFRSALGSGHRGGGGEDRSSGLSREENIRRLHLLMEEGKFDEALEYVRGSSMNGPRFLDGFIAAGRRDSAVGSN